MGLQLHPSVTLSRREATTPALFQRLHGYLASRFDTGARVLLVV